MSAAQLVILDQGKEKAFVPLSGSTAIGSADTAQIRLDGDAAAEEAVIEQDGQAWMLRDLGGQGRVMVNDGPAEDIRLLSGDNIEIAGAKFLFRDVAEVRVSSRPRLDSAEAIAALREQLAKVIVGQDDVIDQVLIAILCRAHALLIGAPGLAKTLLVSSLAKALDLSFRRVQFTPDLMPADITGTDVLEEDPETGRRRFRFVPGPLFTNLLLTDEINRTPPKTQAALLEAMQERQVSIGDTTHPLPEPFFVLATQNPIEQEGTFPLPEAQLDRFLINILVGYPSESEEEQVVRLATSKHSAQIEAVLGADDIRALQDKVTSLPVADHVVTYATKLARMSRPADDAAPGFVRELVSWGAGPRAAIGLVAAAKASAVLRGASHATTADVTGVAKPVLRHRIIPTFAAEASGATSDDIVQMLLDKLQPSKELEELDMHGQKAGK